MALSDLLAYAAIVGFAVLVGFYARWDIRRRARKAGERRAWLIGYATHREWQYADSDPALLDRFHGHPFDQGNERYTRNVFTGRHGGREFVAFDYEAVVRRRKSTDRYPYSVVALEVEPPVIEVLMQHPDDAWRLDGSSMVVVDKGHHSPEEIEARLHFLAVVLDRLPRV